MSGPQIVVHPSRDVMAAAVADTVETALRHALAARGRAHLAVPGGSTPGPFLTHLGQAALEWETVGITLTDERWVPLSSDRSNQGMLSKTLFAGQAAAAEFVPLYGATAEPADAIDGIAIALRQIVLPLDVCVLGMGADMHTASLFPDGLGLEAALAPDAPPAALIRAPGAEEPRVTLTAPVLQAAKATHLLIQGADKRQALDRAMAEADPMTAPVRVVLTPATTIHYAD